LAPAEREQLIALLSRLADEQGLPTGVRPGIAEGGAERQAADRRLPTSRRHVQKAAVDRALVTAVRALQRARSHPNRPVTPSGSACLDDGIVFTTKLAAVRQSRVLR
jgi:hypothetical protein